MKKEKYAGLRSNQNAKKRQELLYRNKVVMRVTDEQLCRLVKESAGGGIAAYCREQLLL